MMKAFGDQDKFSRVSLVRKVLKTKKLVEYLMDLMYKRKSGSKSN